MIGQVPQILVVDDDARDTQLTQVALESSTDGYGIVVARDGTEALDYLYQRGKFQGLPKIPPALILLDLKMPKLDGFEVLRTVKQADELRSIPIIVFTSSQHAGDVETCYRLGANAYVVKPVAFDQLLKTMEALSSFWLRTNIRSIP
jgi:CheY-like chemotaxis protein